MKTNTAIRQLLENFEQQGGSGYIGEPVSQLDHGLQAAALAHASGADETLILAALLHDIGHWCIPGVDEMPGLGTLHHEKLGQQFLDELGLVPTIGQLVAMHVDAKRYLAASMDYQHKLSTASRETLKLQGGPMNEEECKVFAQRDLAPDALKLRAWDEAAKEPDLRVNAIGDYSSMLHRNLVNPLTDEQLMSWHSDGFLHLQGWYSEQEMLEVSRATTELEELPETPGKWMKYFEQSKGERQLCRVENFLQYQSCFKRICCGSSTMQLLSLLIGSEARLFKEKINFKLPGGQGFAPHQDAPAFTTFDQRYHVTMMLSIDASTRDNGCLEIAQMPGLGELLPVNDDLTLTPDVVDALRWIPIETAPGDLVLFDSYLPHRSGDNTSSDSRRALYATYNRSADGDYRDDYFRRKRKSFPPDAEREAGVSYDAGVFNVGNPVSVDT